MPQVDPSFVKRADFRAAVPGEFIDYVFSDASGAAKTILADGFGLDAFLGFAGQEEEVRDYDSDDDDLNQMKGVPEDRIGQPRNVPGIFLKHILQEPKSRTVNACVSRGPGSQFRIIIYTIGRNGQVQVSSHFVPISGHGRPCRSPCLTATERPKCPGWHGPRPCCRWAFHAMPPLQPLMRSPRSQTHHSGFVSTVPLPCILI